MKEVIQAALHAGQEIMNVYETDFDVEEKEDHSPITKADEKAHEIIVKHLEDYDPSIPILSEEGSDVSYSKRQDWDEYWLVDPLDGTKEFVKRNGEFTVNIALIRDEKPVFGVVYAPALQDLYVADAAKGAYKFTSVLDSYEDGLEAIRLPAIEANGETATVIVSRSHQSDEEDAFVNELKESYSTVDTISSGSSLKLCLIAEGVADFYPRYKPTMEWDTAAGQAIVEIAGGFVHVANTDKDLTYNKESLKNPSFIANRV
ncbi:3'(2'),5'-bisphosphate nucleotidase CysQ [Salimicrobium halophilum]|uniref:3'(2'),5'-bisphosphate nucleotidase CysQ n=1 Tax=Salimicrobium halophilum TaxID=86666 RepID=A0A1G8V589_9BACI|nr:3'(2'),5'-bisphosphate nucleotidase CysQ [Salimicrobium halophilum]SDJ60515.1 3'(2'),5'-bisphosphate nucleotidase [Salimicrobium halophilum]